MTSGDFRGKGIALVERVRSQVDAREGLDRLRRSHRRRRVAVRIAGVVVAIAVIVTPAVLARLPDRTMSDPPAGSVTTLPTVTTTAPASPRATSLPLTVYLALLDDFVVEGGEPQHCTGAAGRTEVRVGTPVAVLDDRPGGEQQIVAESLITEPGLVISETRAQELGLPEAGSVCLLELATVFTETANVGSLRIAGEPWPSPNTLEPGTSIAGRQFVFYSRGESP